MFQGKLFPHSTVCHKLSHRNTWRHRQRQSHCIFVASKWNFYQPCLHPFQVPHKHSGLRRCCYILVCRWWKYVRRLCGSFSLFVAGISPGEETHWETPGLPSSENTMWPSPRDYPLKPLTFLHRSSPHREVMSRTVTWLSQDWTLQGNTLDTSSCYRWENETRGDCGGLKCRVLFEWCC